MAKFGQCGIDVYETDTLPESDQNFASKEGSLASENLKSNPFGQLAEYGIAGTDASEETLDQKLQKLWIDVVEFQDELKTAKEKAKSDEVSQKTLSESGDLLKRLDSLKGLLGNVGSKVNLTDPQGTLHKKLLADIDKFKSKKPDDGKSEEADEVKLNYQLFFPTKDLKFDRLSKIGEIEKRLTSLQHIMGRTPEIPTPLMIETTNKSLLEIVSSLVAKSKVLESQNWNDVENKAGSVLKRMDQIAEKKDIMEQKAKMDKISELYHIMLKWQKLSSMLPRVVDRLTTLKTLHEQSLEFKDLLGNLEVTQQQISVQLKGHFELLKSVQSEISKNLSTIKTNCESIENKLKNINK